MTVGYPQMWRSSGPFSPVGDDPGWMFTRQRVSPELLRIAHQQDQVVTRAQALASGLTPHGLDRLASETWTIIARGIYYLGGGEPS